MGRRVGLVVRDRSDFADERELIPTAKATARSQDRTNRPWPYQRPASRSRRLQALRRASKRAITSRLAIRTTTMVSAPVGSTTSTSASIVPRQGCLFRVTAIVKGQVFRPDAQHSPTTISVGFGESFGQRQANRLPLLSANTTAGDVGLASEPLQKPRFLRAENSSAVSP